MSVSRVDQTPPGAQVLDRFITESRARFCQVRRAVMSVGSGADGIRTHDPLRARQVLSQLSYRPPVTEERKIIRPTGPGSL